MNLLKSIYLNRLLSYGLACVILFTFTNCDDDDPIPVNEEEVITTVIVTLTPAAGPVVTLQSQDLDGDGPNPPVVTVSGPLTASTTYQGTVEFLNETETPAEDVTEEIEEEDEDHQVFYQVTGGIQLDINYLDEDADGNPLGLEFELISSAAGNGNLVVTLRHLPDKNAAGVSDVDITNAGGETDIAQSFAIEVQ